MASFRFAADAATSGALFEFEPFGKGFAPIAG
jgi:hypothetical protein